MPSLHRIRPTSETVADAVRRAVTIEAGKLANQLGRTRRTLPLAAWVELAETAKLTARQEARRNGFPMNKTAEINRWATEGFVAARTKILLS